MYVFATALALTLTAASRSPSTSPRATDALDDIAEVLAGGSDASPPTGTVPPAEVVAAVEALDEMLTTTPSELVGAAQDALDVVEATITTPVEEGVEVTLVGDENPEKNNLRLRKAVDKVTVLQTAVQQVANVRGAPVDQERRQKRKAERDAKVAAAERRIRIELMALRVRISELKPHDLVDGAVAAYNEVDALAEYLGAHASGAMASVQPAYNPTRPDDLSSNLRYQLHQIVARAGGPGLVSVLAIAVYGLGPMLGRLLVYAVSTLLAMAPGASLAGFMPTVMFLVFTLMTIRHARVPLLEDAEVIAPVIEPAAH